MKQDQFVTRYQPEWEAFETAIKHLDAPKKYPYVEGGLGNMPQQFRRICKQLSLARRRHYSQDIVTRLNRMVLAGHQHFYKPKPLSIDGLSRLLFQSFPRAVRREWRFFWVANALFYGPGLIVFFWSLLEPSLVYSLGLPTDVFEDMYDPNKEWTFRDDDLNFRMFGYYIYNNIGIGFRTFASGLLCGVGSMFFLIFNGVHLGAVFGHLYNVESHMPLLQFVVAHGSFELTAITLAGQAGLMLGMGVIRPGDDSRIQSIVKMSKRAMPIVYGMAIMLFIAAIIEAFWSPMPLSLTIKFTVGGCLWAFVIAYLALIGRRYAH